MKLSKFHVIVILIFFGAGGCIEPFNPDIPESDNSLLVVNGIITDQPGPYLVTISKVTRLNEDLTPVSGVQVSIEDEGGILESLQEIDEGIYQTTEIQGIAGTRYRLKLNYLDENYQSSWEMINSSPEIDSVYFKIENLETSDINNEILGMRFFVDSYGSNEDSRYYRFEMEETWKIGVSWPITYDYSPIGMYIDTQRKYNLFCWKRNKIVDINLASSIGLTENMLSNHKMNFVTGEEDRFARRYSILIRQFGLSEQEYMFWKQVSETSGGVVGLFEKQPANVKSNISNITNPSKAVLGYFSASGLRSKRIYINPEQVPDALSRQYKCPLDSVLKSDGIGEYSLEVFYKLQEGKLFYEYVYDEIGGEFSGALFSTLKCSDCVENGGSAEKPDFWYE